MILAIQSDITGLPLAVATFTHRAMDLINQLKPLIDSLPAHDPDTCINGVAHKCPNCLGHALKFLVQHVSDGDIRANVHAIIKQFHNQGGILPKDILSYFSRDVELDVRQTVWDGLEHEQYILTDGKMLMLNIPMALPQRMVFEYKDNIPSSHEDGVITTNWTQLGGGFDLFS